ncbi:MAG: DNA gyrase subunit A [Lachnospiraceae bacterium]|nr:DNA gyrase subunit A [Lachnospiraceae bacterium]
MEANIFDKVKNVDLKNTMENSYIDYAMSVIVARALPDVRDGLKPVQRRILYALQQLGVTSDKKTKKCATIVGETMGKYHPHGDSSIYGALVGMGQPWNYRQILIDKQGNFGSEDGDSPAAMRYTEAKMSKMAEYMLDGINKDTVELIPNVSNEYKEPVVLPARFPNLLVNGTTGIAVGMATNIPPHNLSDVINAVIKIIDDKIEEKETTIKDMLDIIKGPDFPTGAKIEGIKGINSYLSTGRGKVKIKSVCEIEPLPNGKQKIVVKELPYLVHRSELIAKIADLVKEKKIEGITAITDAYGKTSKAKIVIDLRKDANANVILNKLYKMTDLQSSFSVIMLCIVNGEPKILNVLELLQEFLKHQIIVVTRRTKYDLKKCEERAHILEGLLKALLNIDEVIKTIKESKDTREAQDNLIQKFGFSERQAEAIVEMKLKALTNLESDKLKEEYDDLEKKIAYYKELLSDEKKLLGVIKDELSAIEQKHHDERTTVITKEESEEITEEDIIEEANVVVTMTHMGYIKRMDGDTFKTQGRGGRGVKGMQTLDNDFIEEVFMTSNKSTLMFVTNLGRMYTLKGYDIPEAGRNARGQAIVNLLSLKEGEYVKAGKDIKEFSDDKYLVFATKNGVIKKTKLSEYANVRNSGIKALNIKDGDEVISVKVTTGQDDIFLITKNGLCSRFSEENIREMGRTASGVRGIKIKENDSLISMLVTNEGKELLLVSENGIGKRTDREEFSVKGRGGKGMLCYKTSDRTGKLIGAELVDGDEDIMIINDKGLVIRLSAKDISCMGRNSAGVRLMKSEDDSKVASVTKVLEEK